jgi:carbon monoxide dehydrogenase subunit G
MTGFKMIRTAWAAAAAAALAVSMASPAAAEGRSAASGVLASPSVSVTNASGAYHIEGSFRVDTPATVVWAVLTDYDRVSSFVSSMRSSTAQRESGRLLVTQEAVGRAGPFSRTMHVVLEVTERAPERIAFRDVCGGSFHSYAGSWTISPEGTGVRVTYVLDARPRSSPPLFAKSIMSSNARGLLEQVRVEILRRGRTASSSSY